jgi:LmbE family N-acetylglucosaminyl deacetylase
MIMKRRNFIKLRIFLFVVFSLSLSATSAAEPVRVIVFGAHPDDCEYTTGGIAALYTQMGHQVKYVSMTNGNKGHHLLKPAELAARRSSEAKEVARILGVEYEIMNNDDGELLPTMENRFAVIKMICDWKADIVITHRPNDYHPDHRYAAAIVQDAAYMISVPLMVPEGKPLLKPVVFLYMPDDFRKPTPFSPDIVIDITSVAEKKADAFCANESQFYEWMPWNESMEGALPDNPAERRRIVGNRYLELNRIEKFRKAASKWYTAKQLKQIRYVESFEICEYGYIPGKEEIKRLFPMLPQ